MIKNKILLLMGLLACVTARAYDFADTLPSGQVLYYSFVTGGVEVVHPNSNVATAWSGYVKPTGVLAVPASVSHGGTAYTIVAVSDYAFRNCTGLTEVSLAGGIVSVGIGAFYGCSALVSLTLPASLATVDDVAFGSASALTHVWMQGNVPPNTSATAFYMVDLSACTLQVPCGATAAYSVEPWSLFDTVVEGLCSAYIATAVNDAARGSVTGAGTYIPGSVATLTAVPEDGYSFICWNDGDTLNPRQVLVMTDSLFIAMFFAQPDVVYIHDTVHDTILPTFYAVSVSSDNIQLGVGVGSAVLPAGTEVEVCGLPLEGGRFAGWDDGVTDNPRRVTVSGPLTLRALFAATLPSATSTTEFPEWTVTATGRQLTVICRAGERLRLYDLQGRCHQSLTTVGASTTLPLPSAGVWLVQVGEGTARKIVIDD